MQIQMRGNNIGVEKLKKASKKTEGFIVMPESVDALGVIRYIGSGVESELKVGMKVYYGTKRQQIRMRDADIEVMEESNVFAVVEDSNNEKQEKA